MDGDQNENVGASEQEGPAARQQAEGGEGTGPRAGGDPIPAAEEKSADPTA